MNPPSPPPAVDTDAPLNNFSHCHAGILHQLDHLRDLAGLLAPARRAHQIASDMLGFFRPAAFEHHQEEERELFPAVLASSLPGEERQHVQVLVDALTREHRDIERQWAALEPHLKKLAKGQPTVVDPDAIRDLVDQYKAHARFEEMEFLPLSQQILGRNGNHLAALGLSLHIRHQPRPPAYI
jgi:hemerythrin-like domain-containing protein